MVSLIGLSLHQVNTSQWEHIGQQPFTSQGREPKEKRHGPTVHFRDGSQGLPGVRRLLKVLLPPSSVTPNNKSTICFLREHFPQAIT